MRSSSILSRTRMYNNTRKLRRMLLWKGIQRRSHDNKRSNDLTIYISTSSNKCYIIMRRRDYNSTSRKPIYRSMICIIREYRRRSANNRHTRGYQYQRSLKLCNIFYSIQSVRNCMSNKYKNYQCQRYDSPYIELPWGKHRKQRNWKFLYRSDIHHHRQLLDRRIQSNRQYRSLRHSKSGKLHCLVYSRRSEWKHRK